MIAQAAGAMLLACAAAAAPPDGSGPAEKQAALRAELKKLPWRVVYESCREGNWDLHVMNADGTGGVNLTHTAKVDEMYPHASPDGRRISFVADEGAGRERVRSVHVMSADGRERKLVARNARQPCWGPDSRRLLYARSEYERFTLSSYATKELVFCDLAADRHRPHLDERLLHVTYLCWSPCGRWVFGTVEGGMGFGHANLAIEAEGTAVHRLTQVGGCRMDFRPDGRGLLWNATDQDLVVADLDLAAGAPKVGTPRTVVSCAKPDKVYHGDFSPDGRFILFSHGPQGQQHVGMLAPGWHIYVAAAAETNVWVRLTSDGEGNKEPDWLPAAKEQGT